MKIKKGFILAMISIFSGLILMSCDTPDQSGAADHIPVRPLLFNLNDVTLLEGPFKTALDLNTETLLKYDVDRLLAPFRKAAGLAPKAASYSNWENLDGHIGGHYLSALAMTWAVTQDQRIKQRIDYMLGELKACQDKNGSGYAGGVVNSAAVWNNIKNGSFGAAGQFEIAGAWVPWYNVHKMFAGLRDAWYYTGSRQAKEMFLAFCDWGLTIISGLSDVQMEKMLDTEYGGMNEVYANAYEISGNQKYLNAAIRFSHNTILTSLSNKQDNLNNLHANTQVPKVVGYSVVARNSQDARFLTASNFFWDRVVNYRSLAFGGNSMNEHFRADNNLYLELVEGPETCNTNNMLKLSENLFIMEQLAKYGDYYERALYNHILASQHPQTGGYVYFTPARPEHYRVYSTPGLDMWCCVGTGMENHAKYGSFIYANTDDALYVNLFIASELNWKAKNITVKQTTNFPGEETSTLTINTSSPAGFKLRIRYPWWIGQGGMKVTVNGTGTNYAADKSSGSFVEIDRIWNNGDKVQISMPMDIYVETIPNVSGVVAIMRGPVLLCAETETESGLRIFGDGSRMGHVADGARIDIDNTPVIISEPEEIIAKLQAMQTAGGSFTVPGLSSNGDVVLKPFFQAHGNRYMMYWMAMTQEEYDQLLIDRELKDQAQLILENRTVDRVTPNTQTEAGQGRFTSSNSSSGTHQGENWRDANNGGYFQYVMDTRGETDLSLMVRYWGNEGAWFSRTFDILIDDQKLVTETVSGSRFGNINEFVNVEYPINSGLLTGKTAVTVRFQCSGGNIAGGVFNVRLLKPAQ